MTTTRLSGWLDAIRHAVHDAGVPTDIGVKPSTSSGQPWAIVSLLSSVFAGDIGVYDDEQNTLVLVRTVGATFAQAEAAYWRADAAVRQVDQFDGGKVVWLSREALTAPTRDDATFPGRSVYYVDATYRGWLAPTVTEQES